MLRSLRALVVPIAVMFTAATASADGELHIYNWTDYTAPDLVKKFEAETGIKVTVDTYDSNETLLAKLKAGGSSYDIVVPSQHFVKILIAEGLIQKVGVKDMPNYQNVATQWQHPAWDPEQEYTAPWHWGSASFAYRSDLYAGKGESLKEFFEPDASLKGRMQVFKTPDETVNLANLYLGLPFCSENPDDWKKVADLMTKQKPFVLTYSSEGMNDRLGSGEVAMASHWNGYSMRGRIDANKNIVYAFPKEGVVGWFDSLAVPVGAKNVENAKKFMNFMMDPKNSALGSNFTGYASAITGAEQYFNGDMKTAPELATPTVPVKFGEACSEKALKLQDKVWTRLLQ